MTKPPTIRELFRQAETLLPSLLRPEALSLWDTLDVDYDAPRVERVWTQVGSMRIYLHRIHPCETALIHPHPWPSAIRLLEGTYEMGIGFGSSAEGAPIPALAAVTILHPGTYYEMEHPDGWHYVKPLRTPSMSLMVTGVPWERNGRHTPGQGANPHKLSLKARNDICDFFRSRYEDVPPIAV